MVKKPPPESLADKLQAIIAAAPALRAAGVTSVGGEIPFTLAAGPPDTSTKDGRPPEHEADLDSRADFLGKPGAVS